LLKNEYKLDDEAQSRGHLVNYDTLHTMTTPIYKSAATLERERQQLIHDATEVSIFLPEGVTPANATQDHVNAAMAQKELAVYWTKESLNKILTGTKTSHEEKIKQVNDNIQKFKSKINALVTCGEQGLGFNEAEKIDCSNKKLTDEHLPIITELLKSNKTITTLDLSNNNITDVTSIINLLKTNETITTLDLSNNTISKPGFFYKALSKIKTIKHLDLSNQNNILDLSNSNITNIESIKKILEKDKTITTLDLSNNNITDVISIINLLKTNETITTLDLSNNNITDVTSIINLLKTNKTITTLDLSNTNITDYTSIIDLLKSNTTITTLDLSNNNIEYVNFYRINYSIRTLKHLDLSNNDLHFDESIMSFVVSFNTNRFNLNYLNLSNNRLNRLPTELIGALMYYLWRSKYIADEDFQNIEFNDQIDSLTSSLASDGLKTILTINFGNLLKEAKDQASYRANLGHEDVLSERYSKGLIEAKIDAIKDCEEVSQEWLESTNNNVVDKVTSLLAETSAKIYSFPSFSHVFVEVYNFMHALKKISKK
jgi:Leucine-rich repeat (LRR) protein